MFSFGSFSLQFKHNSGNIMGQCSRADRLLVKNNARQRPPIKKSTRRSRLGNVAGQIDH